MLPYARAEPLSRSAQRGLRGLIRAELRETELRLQKEITQAKVDLLKWLVPLMFAQVAAIAALVKLL